MKIVTWNVNSLKVRLSALLSWMQAVKPDVVALQETKIIDTEFPADVFSEIGYHVHFTGQKTYNGVALLTRDKPCTDVITNLPGLEDVQRRFLAASWNGYRIINVYVPNGSEIGSDKYQYKLEWLNALQKCIKEQLQQYPKLIVLGDFNIAPTDLDVHDPKIWRDCVLVSEPERAALRDLLNLGLVDLYREQFPEGKDFSWWDYRAAAFRRNLGLRIDLILASDLLKAECQNCWIDKAVRADERPSDHAPMVAEFKLD